VPPETRKANQGELLGQLPNTLTAARLVIALIFPFVTPDWHLTLIVLGLLSEFLDGFLARLLKSTSYLGQVLDPIADKALVLSVSITWVYLGDLEISQWLLLATRDLGVALIVLALIGRGRLLRARAVKAELASKITTALQYLVFFLLLFDWQSFLWPAIAATGLLGLAAALQYLYLLRGEIFRN